jgi:hypothetical protein
MRGPETQPGEPIEREYPIRRIAGIALIAAFLGPSLERRH